MYGRSIRVKEHYEKFLCNRYGEVKHYYSPQVEMAVIEGDIKTLLEEEFDKEKLERLLDPPEDYF